MYNCFFALLFGHISYPTKFYGLDFILKSNEISFSFNAIHSQGQDRFNRAFMNYLNTLSPLISMTPHNNVHIMYKIYRFTLILFKFSMNLKKNLSIKNSYFFHK